MRILFVAPGYKPAERLGGPAVTVAAVAEQLVKRGHEVTVCATNSNYDEDLDVPLNRPVDVDGVRVWYFARDDRVQHRLRIPYLRGSIGFLYAPEMARVLDRLVPEVDLVHAHAPFNYPTVAGARAARRFGRPLFYHQRGMFHTAALRAGSFKKRLYIALFERPIMSAATTLIALTPAEVQSYRALGVSTPCRIVPNGVDTRDFGQTTRACARDRLGISHQAKVILFLGRVHPHKGVERLLAAFPEVQRKVPGALLIVAGPDQRRPADVREQKSWSGSVCMTGMVSGQRKRDLLAAADVLCLPSDSEGFSVAILEALASGTPVVISPGCHFPEVESAGAGRIVSQDTHSIANGLVATLLDTHELSAMGRRAKALAERFRWEHITDTLLDVYEEGLARWRRARSSRVAAIPDATARSAAVMRSTSASAEK